MSQTPPSSPADSAPPPPSPPAHSASVGTPAHPPLKDQLADLLSSLYRLANLQFSIWLAHVRLTVFRIALFTILSLLALLLAFLALLFLYAGIYHVLTDLFLIPTAWSLLIFAAVHFLLAGILVLIALSILKRQPPTKPGAAP
jgi:hypothetical protein